MEICVLKIVEFPFRRNTVTTMNELFCCFQEYHITWSTLPIMVWNPKNVLGSRSSALFYKLPLLTSPCVFAPPLDLSNSLIIISRLWEGGCIFPRQILRESSLEDELVKTQIFRIGPLLISCHDRLN